MADIVLAIDPGTHALGVALFKDGLLVDTRTFQAVGSNRLARIKHLLDLLVEYIYHRKPTTVVIEDPLLRGKSSGTMERLKGTIEAACQIVNGWIHENFDISHNLHYIAPTTVKKYMGHGDMDKARMAAIALNSAKDEMERALIGERLVAKDWDSTDAVCVGLCYLKRKLKKKEKKIVN